MNMELLQDSNFRWLLFAGALAAIAFAWSGVLDKMTE